MRRWMPGAPAPILAVLLCAAVWSSPAAADKRFIVRTDSTLDGPPTISTVCGTVGCKVEYALDDASQVFLVTTPDTVDPSAFVGLIASMGGIRDAQIDAVVRTLGAAAGSVPPALLDSEPVSYFGTTVWRGYVEQPANRIVGISGAQSRYQLTGEDVTVAVIDTGVDPRHPVLAGVLLPGYDFTRNITGGSELNDLDQSTIAVLDQSTIAVLDQSTIAVLDQSTIAVLDQSTIAVLDQSTIAVLDSPQYAAFGHGTLVAGIVHLTAPRASIMPLKTFRADGTGYLSDVIRAVYYAVKQKAKVINMSFSLTTPSTELERAISFARAKKVITVASVGNDGQRVTVYPAALSEVIGVASSTDYDTLSIFSNFGTHIAWIAAPGEGIVTTYPFATYAAAWGTSFSAPFGTGAAALLADLEARISARQAGDAEGQAVWISPDVNRGRLDIPAAIRAWLAALPK